MPTQPYDPPETGVSPPERIPDSPLTDGASTVTYDTACVAQQINAPSERWVIDQIRAGRFPARKIGRAWRMTLQDIAEALDACRNPRRSLADADVTLNGLTPTSRKRLGGAAS